MKQSPAPSRPMGRSSSSRLPSRSPPPPPSVKKRMYEAGSKVEARSEEDGFSGGWFKATITRVLHKKQQYAVSYDNIVADDAPEKPLTESLRCSLLRPRPPADPTVAGFGIYQCVEAFHNEGWWPGVVCKLPDGGRELYSVYFPASREEFPFKASELRRCLEWVKRNWVSVEEAQEGAHVMFGEGTQVEVSRDKENFAAAWFVGTVLKVIGGRYFLIEYENIRVDIDGGAGILLKEIVDLKYIRPCPQASMRTSFDVLDEVEVFQRDGWYAGVVSVILPGSQYIVKYKYQEGEMSLDHTSLRPACVWVDDHWVDISRDSKVNTPGRTKPDGRKRKSSSGIISASAAGNDDHIGEGSNFPSVKRKKEDGPRKNRMMVSSSVSKMSQEGSLRGSFSVHVPTYKEDDGEASDGSAVATCKSKDATEPGVKGGPELRESGKKSHASEESNLSSPVLTSHKKDSEVYDIIGVTNLKDRNVEEPSFQDKSSQSRKKWEKGKALKEHLQSVDSTPMDCGSKIPTTVGEGNTAAMPMLESSPALVSEELQSRSPSHEIYAQKSEVVSNSQAIPLSRELCHGPRKTTTTRQRKQTIRRTSSRHGKTPDIDDVMHNTPEVEEEHTGCITPAGNESQRLKEGTEQVVGCEENSPRNDETLSHKQSHIMVDACVTLVESSIENGRQRESQALLACLQGNVATESNQLASAKPQSDGGVFKSRETMFADLLHREVSPEKLVLPFSKRFKLWELLESMEVFRSLPQQPHFHPLHQFDEELREGMAIGLMTTFAELVDDISRMRIDDSKQDFEVKMKILGHLESHGFNVLPMRARLERLLQLRGSLIQVEDRKQALGAELASSEEEDKHISSQMFSVEKELADLGKKRESLLHELRKTESKIAVLKSGVQEAEESRDSINREFTSVLAAPW